MAELSDFPFPSKISVLYETTPLWSEEDFNDVKNKLDRMSNIYYYIKSDDLAKVINSTDKKIYVRLIIDSPRRCKRGNSALSRRETEDNMSISDSPGRNSKSHESIKERKSKRLSRTKNNNDNIYQNTKTISIKTQKHLIYYVKNEEKYSVFICRMKDNKIYCNAVKDDHIKGSKFCKLLTYESVDVDIDDIKMTINSLNIKNLNFPIYFILSNSEITIEKFLDIIESILDCI